MKNPVFSTLRRSRQSESGFALVATLAIVALITILTMGLLSLSQNSLKRVSSDKAKAEAQARARMALMLAIGELQKNTGGDMRVTAPANIVDKNYPPLVGVWRSWEGTDHEANGRPIAPDYASKDQAQAGGGRFIDWLVSRPATTSVPIEPSTTDAPDLVQSTAANNTIPLLAGGSLPNTDPRQIHVVPTKADGGRTAWWISGENQKARLAQPHQPDGTDVADWGDLQKSHAIPDPEPFGLGVLLDDPEPYNSGQIAPKGARKAITLATADLISGNNTLNLRQSFFDLTTVATGLLTNAATGGWKKDLSLLSERWSGLPASGLPLFRKRPIAGETTSVSKPTTTNPTAAGSIFYPWSNYVASSTQNTRDPFPTYYMEQHGAVASWHSLVDYVTSYKTMDYEPSGVGSVPLTWARTHRITPWGPSAGNFGNQDLFNYLHANQKSPVLARIQWVFKVRSRRMNQADPNTRFNIDLLVTPVYTLWNPHNVAIRIDQNYGVSMNKTMPVAIAIAKGSEFINYNEAPDVSTLFRRYTRGSIYDLEGNRQYDSQIVGNYRSDWEDSNGQAAGFPTAIVLQPGEARQFSLAANTPVGNTGVMGVLKEGYDGASAFGFARFNSTTGQWNATRNNFLRTDTLKFGLRFDNITRLGNATNKHGPGIYMSFGRWAGPDTSNSTSAGNNRYLGDGFANYTMLTNLDYSKAYWEQPPDLPEYSVLAIEGNGSNPPWTPVFSIIWGPRLTMGAAAGNPANRPTKGLVQNSPFSSGVLTTSDKLQTNHPANLAFDFAYVGHESNSDTLPEEGTTGFIVSGNQVGNGLSRVVLGEIPMRPIASLMELQGWDLRARNPLPPFQYNIIGNSDANPMISKDRVVIDSSADVTTNRQHDDAYCANHLLFDDWFVSSIAPEPRNFGKLISRDINTVYRDYLTGSRSLANRAYQPIPDDRGLNATQVGQRVTQLISSNDGWQKVASRFDVQGMFNINSTSVKAWRALLGHARKQQVAYHTKAGIVLGNTPEDYILSRGAIASDVKAGPAKGMAGDFPNASEYTGFRTLTDAQLDLLAERIVGQIRARGPFLSLSEFVNRRLVTDEALALAGAVQTALNSLSAELHPRLQDPKYASTTMSPNDPKMDGADYQFGKAAEGFDTYGLPGWARQADLLRPLAPILSPRDDTFTIRAYADKTDPSGKVVAQAWCEAVVTRTRNFVDDQGDAADSIGPPQKPVNLQFGRRYVITSFRWLSPDEV